MDKKFLKNSATALLIVATVSIFPSTVYAQEQTKIVEEPDSAETTKLPTTAETKKVQKSSNVGNLENSLNQVASTFDNTINSVTGSFSSLLDSVEENVSDFTSSLQIPDPQQILNSVLGGESKKQEAQGIAEVLENKPDGSFAITEDLVQKETIDSTVETTVQATLGSQAQAKLKKTAKAAKTNAEENVALGEDSQGKDVTQQILQNLSKQSALNSEQQASMINLGQQAQVDRALGNILDAEIAKEIAGANTASRRQDSGTANAATMQTGLITVPGGDLFE